MAEQIHVYVCGCGDRCPERGDGFLWIAWSVGEVCEFCDQPVRAVNITALEAKLARVVVWWVLAPLSAASVLFLVAVSFGWLGGL